MSKAKQAKEIRCPEIAFFSPLTDEGLQSLFSQGKVYAHQSIQGIRCWVTWDADDCAQLWTIRGGKVVKVRSVPHINSELEELQRRSSRYMQFDGMLYTHGMLPKDIHEICYIHHGLHEDYKQIQFHVFDIISSEPFEVRKENLRIFLEAYRDEESNLKYVVPRLVETTNDVYKFQDLCLRTGYKGMILRSAGARYEAGKTKSVLEFQEEKSQWFRIVGIIQPKENWVEALICADRSNRQFKAGLGIFINNALPQEVWFKKHDPMIRYAMVSYQMETKDCVPAFGMVRGIQAITKNQIPVEDASEYEVAEECKGEGEEK